MDLALKGKRALITGSTAGIGYAIAHGLAAEGAHVVVTGRTQVSVDGALARLRKSFPGADAAGVRGTVEDVASAVCFLASKDAAYINGHSLVVDGGWRAK